MEANNDEDLCLTYVFRNGIEEMHDIKVRYEKPFHIEKMRAECKNLNNLFWHIFSGLTYYKYSIVDNETGEEMASSYISKNLPHFDFIYRFGGGYHVGPDYTAPKYRGLGLHPFLLTHVIGDILKKDPNTYIYMCVSQGNISSKKGIERVGFHFTGQMLHRDFQYQLIKGTETIPILRPSRRIWGRVFVLMSTIIKILRGLKSSK